ncbi:MAG: pentapeptide repeat-containing protein [Treponema sp.]|nr:pentapeptide repeat-containing protein [Treponema sp.]
MFSQNKCLVHHCTNQALSTFDEDGNITEEKNYCLDHTPNPGKVKNDIYNYIQSHEKIIGLTACGLIFKDIDFSNKQFISCNFYHCTFTNIHCQNVIIRMSFFDFAVFNDCAFINSNILFSSFSGSTFSHTLFTSSDIIQNNFNGIKGFQSSFDNSDLFNSRFIKAILENTSFRNCNIKKTLFQSSVRRNVSFKMSNTREAIFNLEGSDIQLGQNTDNEAYSNTEDTEGLLGNSNY